MGEALALGDAAAAFAIEADGVDLVDVGQRIPALRRVEDLLDRRDVAVHRIEAFEHDELRPLERLGREQLLEMGDVVVAEDLLLAARAPHALYHRIVVERVGEDEAVRQEARNRRDRGEVRDPARRKGERRGLPVQVGELGLELDDRMVGAGDVARAAGARAMRPRGLTEASITSGWTPMPR